MKIQYDDETKKFSAVETRKFANPPKPKPQPKPKDDKGGGPFESDRRTRLIKFDYNGKKHIPSFALSKLRLLNAVLAEAYETGFINDFFPVNDYKNVYVEGTKGDAFDIEIPDYSSGVHPGTPSGTDLKFKVSYYNVMEGRYIGSQFLTIEELRKWLAKTAEMTQRAAEDNWKRAGKIAAGVAKGVGRLFKAFFDESPLRP